MKKITTIVAIALTLCLAAIAQPGSAYNRLQIEPKPILNSTADTIGYAHYVRYRATWSSEQPEILNIWFMFQDVNGDKIVEGNRYPAYTGEMLDSATIAEHVIPLLKVIAIPNE